MKNNSHTQTRSPNLTKSNLPNQQPILLSLWLLIIAVGALSLAICAIAIINLTSTGNLEKDPTKQTTVATQTPNKNQSNSSPNWLLTIVLLGSGIAITAAIYKRRHNLPKFPQRGLTRRQQRKLSLQEVPATTATTETLPNNSAFINLKPALKLKATKLLLMF
jgi:heme/copper-type cytochrome/quinol oxidase subunit 3